MNSTSQAGTIHHQQQFPPPPPYSPNGTVMSAPTPSSAGNVVIDMQSKQQSTTACSSCQMKLKRALMQFRVYKKAMASTLWFSSFWTVYLFFLLVTFPEMRIHFFLMMVPFVCAILGVFSKQTLLLFPLLIEQLIAIGTLLAFITATVYVSIQQPDAWEAFIKEEFKTFVHFFGFNTLQMTIAMIVFFCFDILCIWIQALDLLDTIKGMSKHCNKVHKIALSMAGLSTDLKDPALVQHLRWHITERISAKNTGNPCA